MKRFALWLALLPSLLCAQSVPNGTITQGQVWTPAQWNAAWQSKADASGGVLYSPLINGSMGVDANRSSNWLGTYLNTVGYTNFAAYGSLFALNTAGLPTVGATFGAQGLYATNSGAAVIADSGYAVTNNLTYNNNAWGTYRECHRQSTGNCYGAEYDTVNLSNAANTPSPYAQGNVVGVQIANGGGARGGYFTGSTSGSVLTIAGWSPLNGWSVTVGDLVYCSGVAASTNILSFAGGGGGNGTYNLSTTPGTIGSESCSEGPQFPASAAIQIEQNPAPHNAGIVFGATSLSGNDGVTGNAPAIMLAHGDYINWYNPAGSIVSSIQGNGTTTANGTKIQFTEVGLQIANVAGGSLAYFFPVPSAVNYLTFTAGATTVSPSLSAAGGDSNVDLTLNAQGSGKIYTPSPLTAATVRTTPITIASLPSCVAGIAGTHASVSNGVASPTYYATVSTTGAVTDSVFCNGSSWVYD